jgi:signal transduction histidine kinase
MALRGQKDYNAVRDFTAQAAHEMQTPLAVLRGKLEALMQAPNVDSETAAQITGIDNSVERLTRLFQSMLLLTRIKHQSYAMDELLSIDSLVKEKTGDLIEIINSRHISLHTALAPLQITCNKYLAEVLIGNLLINAIRYNFDGGRIELSTDGRKLRISNTSHLPQIDESALFRPFFRHPDVQQEGHGLGLSIVAQICETCSFGIAYSFSDSMHTFELTF